MSRSNFESTLELTFRPHNFRPNRHFPKKILSSQSRLFHAIDKTDARDALM